jgi:hypothetical protein
LFSSFVFATACILFGFFLFHLLVLATGSVTATL